MRRDPLGFFMECARCHGDVISMRLGRHQVYLLSHPDHVKHVLQDNARAYAKGPPATRVRGLFGDSLTVVDGDRWRRRRRQVQPAFQAGQHAQFASVVSRATGEMLERWRPLAERNEPVDAVTEMRRLTQTIIIRACFGDVPTAEVEALGRALDVAVGHVDRRLWSALGWLEVPTPAAARYQRALGAMDAFVSRMVSEARRSAPLPRSLLAALLASSATGEPLSDAELRDELKAVLVAGHTTTASALAWTWHVLSERQDAREQLEEECRAILGGRAPGVETLPRLGYTRRVIEEVLRLYPPTWLTARMPADLAHRAYARRGRHAVRLHHLDQRDRAPVSLRHPPPSSRLGCARGLRPRSLRARPGGRAPELRVFSLRRRLAPLYRQRLRHHRDASHRRIRGPALPADAYERRTRHPRRRPHVAPGPGHAVSAPSTTRRLSSRQVQIFPRTIE